MGGSTGPSLSPFVAADGRSSRAMTVKAQYFSGFVGWYYFY
jgi:hypothetical protein